MIAALAHQRVIGQDQQMPWHLPADFAFFKKTTIGSPILMGRKTYESIGHPLPHRLNLVMTRNATLQISGCEVVSSLAQAMHCIDKKIPQADELFITGGAHLYHQFLDQADRLYLTLIEATLDGDTFFPDYQQYQWEEVNETVHFPDDKNNYKMTFVVLDRIR